MKILRALGEQIRLLQRSKKNQMPAGIPKGISTNIRDNGEAKGNFNTERLVEEKRVKLH